MNAVPVCLGYPYGGLAEYHGMFRDEGDHLVLEYQSKDAVIGVLKSDIREVRIPRDLLASLTFRKSWLGLKMELVVQTTRMEPVADVPGMTPGRLVLRVARTDWAAAEKLVADFRLPDPLSAKPAAYDTGLE